MRILVTGAFGYLGLALIRRLAATGHTVIATGHPPRVAAARAAIPEGVVTVEGDLEEIGAAVAGATTSEAPLDAIVHLAGGGGPARVEADPAAAVRANVLGTSRLMAAARAAGVARVIFASSIAVYGSADVGRPLGETDAAGADDLYGALKLAAEHIVTSQGGVALRLASVYGAGCGVDVGLEGVVERFARAAAAGGELTVYGGGGQRIDLVHIDDLLDVIAAALAARTLPPILNVGGGAPVTIGTLASACVSAAIKLDVAPRIVAREPPPGPRKVWPDRSLRIGLIGNTFGWRPRVKLQPGIDELVSLMSKSRNA